jgi:hypothetical protein
MMLAENDPEAIKKHNRKGLCQLRLMMSQRQDVNSGMVVLTLHMQNMEAGTVTAVKTKVTPKVKHRMLKCIFIGLMMLVGYALNHMSNMYRNVEPSD